MEPEIVSFDDIINLGGEDHTDPASSPVPTSQEDQITEEIVATVKDPITDEMVRS